MRQCFCRHEFEKSVHSMESGYRHPKTGEKVRLRDGNRISLLCMKCGYHRSFWEV